jgi:hypothetical protein
MVVVDSTTQGNEMLDDYFVRPESSLTSRRIVQGISDQRGVFLEAEALSTVGRKTSPGVNKAHVLGPHTFHNMFVHFCALYFV